MKAFEMVKKKWFHTLIFILIPILTIWIYLQFFKPRYLFQEPQEMDVVVSASRSYVLKSEKPELAVESLEIDISGEIDGIVTIYLENSARVTQIISLKGPKIEHSFAVPWKEPFCTLAFQPHDKVEGKFHVSYRFMETD